VHLYFFCFGIFIDEMSHTNIAYRPAKSASIKAKAEQNHYKGVVPPFGRRLIVI
jgi:hypothetical protein